MQDRIKSIDAGEEMIYFDLEEFDKLSQDSIIGKIPKKANLRMIHKNEKGHFISSKSL